MAPDGFAEFETRQVVLEYVLGKVSAVTLRTLLRGDLDEKLVSNEFHPRRVALLTTVGGMVRVEYKRSGHSKVVHLYSVEELKLVRSG